LVEGKLLKITVLRNHASKIYVFSLRCVRTLRTLFGYATENTFEGRVADTCYNTWPSVTKFVHLDFWPHARRLFEL